MKALLLLILLISSNIFSSDTVRVDLEFESESRHYLIYEPPSKTKATKIVIGLHGYTGSASGFEKETTGGFNQSADKYNFIAVYPQGSYFYETKPFGRFLNNTYVSSWNDLTGSRTKTPNGETCAIDATPYPKFANCNGKESGRCAWASCGNDIGFIKKVIDRVKDNFNIDEIYIVGMSNGGMMAHALACEFPDLLTGVVNIVGSPALDLGCKPKKPINYIIYGGLKDDTVPPVDVVSWDKYYYTPIETVTDNWSKSFNCKDQKTTTYNQYDEIHEKIYFNCDNGVEIINLLNIDKGHTWPGINNPNAGYCTSSAQTDITIDKCKSSTNEWGNDFLLKKLLKL